MQASQRHLKGYAVCSCNVHACLLLFCWQIYACLLLLCWQIDGGDPMLLDGNVVLCVRSDDPGGRHFDGQLAHLGMYDTFLNATQVGCGLLLLCSGAS